MNQEEKTHWTQDKILLYVKACMSATGLTRMPSRSELSEYYGNDKLTNAIRRFPGGYYKIAEILNVEMKESETQFGKYGEDLATKLLEEHGFVVERMSTRYAYDLYVNGSECLIAEKSIRWIVRRLTPVECERLQGYPDNYTNIGDWTDSKGKKHKYADSPRYKALGNSIALPQWFWLVQKMRPYLKEKPTLGSLFDGLGGFPLVWQRAYGEGTARWASEIESFCVAVTKRRFGEE